MGHYKGEKQARGPLLAGAYELKAGGRE